MSDTTFDNKRSFLEISCHGEEYEVRDTSGARDSFHDDIIQELFVKGRRPEILAAELGISLSKLDETKANALRGYYTRSIKETSFSGKKYILAS